MSSSSLVGQIVGTGKRKARSFALLFAAVPGTWSVEKCTSWMSKEVGPGEREMALSGALRPQRSSKVKNLSLPLIVKQLDTQRGEETCSRSSSQWETKLAGHSLSRACKVLLSSHLRPGTGHCRPDLSEKSKELTEPTANLGLPKSTSTQGSK